MTAAEKSPTQARAGGAVSERAITLRAVTVIAGVVIAVWFRQRGVRYLSIHGASPVQLRPAQRLLVFSGVVTLGLNIADPLIAREFGKAAFDAVGPLLLVGWTEVGPGLLRSIAVVEPTAVEAGTVTETRMKSRQPTEISKAGRSVEDLLTTARRFDAWHRQTYLRPNSAETLRKHLRIGSGRSRNLVSAIQSELLEES
jgi:hypothetical protein